MILAASLQVLDRFLQSREVALHAGDCLIQPGFCAFAIEGRLIVLEFHHGTSIMRRRRPPPYP